MTLRNAAAVILFVVAALLTSACGSSEPESTPAAETLDDYFGAIGFGSQEEQNRLIEEATVACMAQEGFEYQAATLAGFTFDDDAFPTDPAEFRRQYGYGGAPVLLEAPFIAEESPDDPNAPYYDALSPEEQAAYDVALYGPDLDEEQLSDQFIPTEGCLIEATQSVVGDFQVLFDLQSKLEDLQAQFDADPRIIDVTVDWSTCMTEAGYNYTTLSQPEQEFTALAQQELFSALLASGEDLTSPGTVGFANLDTSGLEALAAEEITVANADQDCRDLHVNEVEQEVREELEPQFIEENRELLDNVVGGSATSDE
ncbi:MAG: hypothetical protein KJO36_07380 [Acidimicrobiia bacterium]|nr:hypothetical protein [Acidimicrobiia bacterium]MBT8248780.1 hypothetical protein [Acidimicrobiia bacterium]NNL26954.1 hypothetical protein [Acidimicrobiia bacterium]